eukprot:CAMPEP_0173135074 /NCGR_PEP_ID=MMETSP1105-20130129/1673_1 /TAXON_ID=2985 /ORGANISM="Ochromonas sp., Strain BG-1" /LENGTH=713 /DNA_ID=CAMNT_0014046999 /DNA_START=62 /DNA_END=2200 /DNA_ORIENTATION=+
MSPVLLIALMCIVTSQLFSLSFGNFINSDEREERLLELFKYMQDPYIRDVFQPPVLVLVAMQSSGKSSLVEMIVGYPITYTANKAATRCPVRYIIRRSTGSTPTAKFNGQSVQIHEVLDMVKDHMKMLSEKDIFSNIELLVEISSDRSMNMDIIDLPGFPVPNEKHYNETVKLIKETTMNPGTILVCMTDRTKLDNAVHFDRKELIKILGTYLNNDHIFINNYMNLAIPRISSIEDFNSYFHNFNNGNEYYVMLNPHSIDLTRKTYDERLEIISNIRNYEEMKFYDEHVKRIEKMDHSGKIHPSYRNKVGIMNTVQSIQNLLERETLKQLPRIRLALQDQLTAVKNEIDGLHQAVEANDPITVRNAYTEYVSDYVSSLRAILDFVSQTVYNKDLELEAVLEPNDLGMTIEEEIIAANGGSLINSFPHSFDLIALKKSLSSGKIRASPEGLIKTLDMKTAGTAAIRRAVKLFGLYIFLTPPYNGTDAEYLSSTQDRNVRGKATVQKAIEYFVEKNSRSLSNSVEWFCNHIKYLIIRHHNDAEKFQLNISKHKGISTHQKFHNLIRDKFIEKVSTVIGKIRTTILEMITDFAGGVEADAHVKMAIFLTQLPFEHDTCTKTVNNLFRSSNEKDLSVALKRNEKDSHAVWAEAFANDCGEIQALTDFLTNSSSIFSIVDVIDGGFVTPQDQDVNQVIRQEIDSQVQRHTFLAKFHVW